MGTNIYLVRRISRKDIDNLQATFNDCLKDLKTSRDTYKVLQPLEDALSPLKEEIHICKISCGWQLLFQSHKDLYDTSWQSMTSYIKKVLDEGTYIMVDEYGDSYTLEDLKLDLDSHINGYTGKTYDQYLLSKGEKVLCKCQDHEYISNNIRWSDEWFC